MLTTVARSAAEQFSETDSGGCPPKTYRWTFGDGGTSDERNPSHTYETAGNHNATLTVTDSAGATCQKAVEIVVTGGVLNCGLSASPNSGCAPLTAQFTGTDSGGCPPKTYSWTFGDGGTSSEQNPSRSYLAAGKYNATLTVTDSRGVTCQKTALIDVTGGAISCLVSATPDTGCAPLAVQFSVIDSGGCPPKTYNWKFGDGGTSNEHNPSHQYQSVGKYTAALTVTDSKGTTCQDSIAVTVTGGTPLSCSVSGDTVGSCAPSEICLRVATVGGCPPYRYGWNFGDSGTGDSVHQCHTYQTEGTYSAAVTVTDANGVTCSKSVHIVIAPSKALTCIASEDTSIGCAPMEVRFAGSGTGGCPPLTYNWDFGDGGTSAIQSPIHTYQDAGIFTAILTITDSRNSTCRDTVITEVMTSTALSCQAVASATGDCTPLAIQFTGNGSGGCPPLKYKWSFGDGVTDTAQNPVHSYQDVGSYTAALTVTDSKNASCQSSVGLVVTGGAPSCQASADASTGCAPMTVQFVGSGTGGCPPLTYYWNFGDGATSVVQNPIHTYESTGSFAAVLTVTDAKSATCTQTVTTTVVGGSLSCSARVDASNGCAPWNVKFGLSSTGGCPPLTYSWEFGDGSSSTEQNPTHSFVKSGLYSAMATVKDSRNVICAAPVQLLLTDTLAVVTNRTPANMAYGLPDTVRLRWDPISDPCGGEVTYGIYDCIEGCYPVDTDAVNLRTNSYLWKGLSYNQTYQWTIIAFASGERSRQSTQWSFSTKCDYNLLAPSYLYPANGATGISTSPYLYFWVNDPCGQSASYELYFGKSDNPPFLIKLSDGYHQLTKLTNRTRYFWRIVAYARDGRVYSSPLWYFWTI